MAYVSDVAVDLDSNQIFVASPRHDRVYVIDGDNNDTLDRMVAVGNGPTGLAVLEGPDYIPTHIKPPQPCTLWSVAVNPTTQKVYVGHAGDNSVTVLSALDPFTVTKTIPLSP